MVKKLELEIDTCAACPWSRIRMVRVLNVLRATCLKQSRKMSIKEYNDIPKWCHLPNKPEVDDHG